MAFYEQIKELKELMKVTETVIKKQEKEQKRHMQNGSIEKLVKLVRPITEELNNNKCKNRVDLLQNEEIFVSIIGVLKKQQESIEELKKKLIPPTVN